LKSSESLRIAILRADEVLPQFVDHHGDYPQMFEALLTAAAADRRHPVTVRFTCFDARTEALPDPTAYDGYLITGSRLSVYDDEAWISALATYLERVMEAGGRILGICFGHQLIAHFFGGRTEPAQAGWAVGVQQNRMLVDEPWMTPGGARLNLIASHKDQVSELPESARVIATSEFCPIGGFVISDQVLTFQGHPEFQPAYSRDLMEMRRELLGEEAYLEGVESLTRETDEAKVGHWMINFLLQKRTEDRS
jgi:GMP synthase-like glutamine amidotransferase